jgi:hypothetical protein
MLRPLLSDLGQIRRDFENAAAVLREEFIEGSPRMALPNFTFPHAVYELWEALIHKNPLLTRPFRYDEFTSNGSRMFAIGT